MAWRPAALSRYAGAADADDRPAMPRGRDLPQSFHHDRALRPGARLAADRALSDDASRGAEHDTARPPPHQPGARAARARLRTGADRLYHHDARIALHHRQPSAPS